MKDTIKNAVAAVLAFLAAPCVALYNTFVERRTTVDRALSDFEKTRDRLDHAARLSNNRADRFYAVADHYDALAQTEEDNVERASAVRMRLSRLLDG